jgi:TolA-binding protein
MMQMQASLIGKDSLIASLQAQLEQLRQNAPGLDSRIRLTARLEQMEQQQRALRQQIADLQLSAARAADAVELPQAAEAAPAPAALRPARRRRPCACSSAPCYAWAGAAATWPPTAR